MEIYDTIKNKINNTFWISSLNTNKITQIVFPDGYTLNNKFIYMGYGLELIPSMNYYASTSFYDIQIGLDGKLYLPERHSISIDENMIKFSNGEIWNRIKNIPVNTSTDYLNLQNIYNLNKKDTTYLYNKMMPIYGSHATVKGQHLPQ